jgi:magnesium-transporting ATPase (P-type)
LPQDTPVADRTNTVFKGTSVSRSNAVAVVVATGTHTQLGKITAMAQEAKKESTPLNKKLRALSIRLIWLTLILSVLIFVSGIIRGQTVVLIDLINPPALQVVMYFWVCQLSLLYEQIQETEPCSLEMRLSHSLDSKI